MRVVVILLAAGSSSRLGRPKQLLEVDNAPLVRVIADRALASRGHCVGIVLGANAQLIRESLRGIDATVIDNPGWEEGMASSIRCGIGWAIERGADGAILSVCDQPFLSTAHFDDLIEAFERHGTLVASRYDDVLGVPALFPKDAFPSLSALTGSRGAQNIIRSTVPILALDFPEGSKDIDSESDVRNHLGLR